MAAICGGAKGWALIQIKVGGDFLRHIAGMDITRFFRLLPVVWIARIALLPGLALLSVACGKKSEPAEKAPSRYEVRGLVRGLPPDHKSLDIEHEDIPGFMPSMTMPFEVRDEKEIADLKLGDSIAFRLNVTRRDSWIDRVRKIEASELQLPTHASVPPPQSATAVRERLHEGDTMPGFKLIDQDGKQVTLETFRGHPFVVTFIFTRCPIPNFCPRMSSNFADLQKAIESASSGSLAATHLLSISFDPEHDTPEVLKQYGEHASADFAIWTFATGTPPEIHGLTKGFSVLVQPESGTISHSLATALVDREGRIAKIWRGNAWNPGEAITALESRP
jgi:protein SCO1